MLLGPAPEVMNREGSDEIYYNFTLDKILAPRNVFNWPLLVNQWWFWWSASILNSKNDLLIDFKPVVMVYILLHDSAGLTDSIAIVVSDLKMLSH